MISEELTWLGMKEGRKDKAGKVETVLGSA